MPRENVHTAKLGTTATTAIGARKKASNTGAAFFLTALTCGLLMSELSQAQTQAAELSKDTVESILSTALILTDSQAISVGLRTFDPSAFGPFDGGDPSGSALERRRSVTTYELPLSWQLTDSDEAKLKTTLQAELRYVRFERDVVLNDVENPTHERNKDSVYAVSGGSEWSYRITEQWQTRTYLGLHLLRHKNRYEGDGSMLPIDPQEALLNVDNTAAIAELATAVIYSNNDSALPWEFESLYSYYYGRTVGGSNNLKHVRPESWSWSNGFTAHWPQQELWDIPNQVRLSAHRVEIGGDVVDTFDTHSYYKLGVGWLFDTHEELDWLTNVGLSVSINIGSSLSGGSLLLLYNEEY